MESLVDWSQSGEQAYILDWADQLGRPGRWLDIGAADGITASNTRALAERGWGGVAVEPAALLFDRLTELYADHDDVDVVQALLAAEVPARLVRFYYSRDLVSTAERENADTWESLAGFMPAWVPAVSVDELLVVLPGPYDFASIDTEGTSIELWDALRRRDAFRRHALVVVEAENGGERWEIQQACLEGWARIATTSNNVLLERL